MRALASFHSSYSRLQGLKFISFAYLPLQALNELSELQDFPANRIVYVMTDFTWNNLKFWNDHDSLRCFIDGGQLDVAIFDAVNDDSIKYAICNN